LKIYETGREAKSALTCKTKAARQTPVAFFIAFLCGGQIKASQRRADKRQNSLARQVSAPDGRGMQAGSKNFTR
jgi:hypothetical protein